MKKLLMGLFVFGILSFSFQANAYTLNDLFLQIKSLQKEVSQLQMKLKGTAFITDLPVLEVLDAINVDQTSAIIGVNVTSLGTPAATSLLKIYYGTTPHPTVNYVTHSQSLSVTAYQYKISSLSCGTKYYFYGMIDSTYSTDGTFTTYQCTGWVNPDIPVVTNPSTTSLTSNSVTINGTISSTVPVIKSSICFKKGSENYGCVPTSTPAISAFSFDLPGLVPNTTYSYFISVNNNLGYMGNSAEKTFTTLSSNSYDPSDPNNKPANYLSPKVEISSASLSSTSNTATVAGVVTDLGSIGSISERGACYGTSSPTSCKTAYFVQGPNGMFLTKFEGLSASTKYYYKIYAKNSNETVYSSVGTFTTTASDTISSITILSPKEGEVYQSGQKANITWSTVGFLPTDKLGLSIATNDSSNRYPFGIITTNDGQETITIPDVDGTSSYDLILKIDGTKVADSDVRKITIKGANLITSSITVISPNNNQSYNYGDKMIIKWNANNVKNNKVSIALNYPDNYSSKYINSYKIIENIYNSGYYEWFIPKEIKIYRPDSATYLNVFEQSNFKISIYDEGYPQNIDSSDNPFTIKSAEVSCPSDSEVPRPAVACPPYQTEIVKDSRGCVVAFKCTEGPQNDPSTQFEKKTSIESNRTLRLTALRMTGDDVKAVQEFLNIVPADGTYGPVTAKAVRVWQGNNGLDVDGSFGDSCYEKMYELLFNNQGSTVYTNPMINDIEVPAQSYISNPVSTSRTLRLTNIRMKGDDVKVIQEYLGIKADGIYGNGTAEAVRNYQRMNSLGVDGSVGPNTRSNMEKESGARR